MPRPRPGSPSPVGMPEHRYFQLIESKVEQCITGLGVVQEVAVLRRLRSHGGLGPYKDEEQVHSILDVCQTQPADAAGG